jgi:hypothetical protein
VLRPNFHAIWNAGGYHHFENYRPDGERIKLERDWRGTIMRITATAFAWTGLVLALATSGIAQRGSIPPLLPDAVKTPGDTLEVTRDDICVAGYTKKVRNVPKAVKDTVYGSYGISNHAPGEYEVDHLISLELGGSNGVKNLWPQSYQTQPWNAHVKDALENRLHKDVCGGRLDLKAAQHDIAKDWIACYKRTFHTDAPLTKRSNHERTQQESPTDTGAVSAGKVWVNTRSGKYFTERSRYFGKTKEGTYMTEGEAKKQGYVAAKGQ